MYVNVAAQVGTTVLRQQQELKEKIKNKQSAEWWVEDISMPHYGGSLGESLEQLLDQVRLFFEAKNTYYMHETNRKRVLAIMVSNLTGQAAAWYTTQQHEISDITALAAALRREFSPPDLQDMGEMDKIPPFMRGLVLQIRTEVVYRQCSIVHQAINVAMEHERAHPTPHHGSPWGFSCRLNLAFVDRDYDGHRGFEQFRCPTRQPEPESMDIGYSRIVSMDECQQRNL
ncbi:hypothetical protein PI124_g20337 [Phytophthora idaei]|nr:hypothetical protein PI125_g11104 [Phytophthora idaei]KAG3140943.1 hypothetical protein PI126_g15724 [Phytophthora idaei]KAG3234608.1 hypothetical protein PI124_g20337 [Phytophthora idaei]